MKAFIILALVAAAAADVSHVHQHRPSSGADVDAVIEAQSSDVRPDGYQSSFQTSNGISAQEEGVLKNAGREDAAIAVQGSNAYNAPDGSHIEISYVADENGYQPQGAHLPTPPPTQPIPEYIQRSIEYIRTHPPAPENYAKKNY